jgi:hypothetical protein
MSNDLQLGGDGDDLELLQAIEAAFGVRLTNAEAGACITVGNLHDVLLQRVHHVDRGALPCLSAIAYRRLKRAIEKRVPEAKVRPQTPLADIVKIGQVAGWWRHLAGEAGLRLPRLGIGGWGFATIVVLLLSPLALLPWLGKLSFARLLASGPLAVVLGWCLPAHLPSRYRTVGDLARATAAMNISSLSWPAGAMRTRDVWDALETIIRDNLLWEGPLDRETRFFPAR